MFFPNIFDAIVLALQASESVLAEVNGKQADVYLHPDLSRISWFEFYRAEELIREGEKEARRLLPQIRTLQKFNEN
jgi:NTE family protein